MIIIKEITIDLWKKYTQPIEINQYEAEGRKLIINLTSRSLPVNVTGAVVAFYAKKPDGHEVYNACEIIDAENGKVSYEITGQTCIKAGELECCIDITKTGPKIVRTQTFKITVNPSHDVSEAVESTSEFNQLTVALGTIAGLIPSGSLAQDENGLHLVGDEEAPGNSQYYGTDGSGGKGFHDLVTAVKHAMYRVGDIIMSVSATNPAGEYGGTWVLWGSGRVPVGVDTTQPEFNTVEKTGGSKAIADVLQHSHNLNVYNIPTGSGDLVAVPMYGGTTPAATISTAQTGAATVSNLQPYITCYMWKKTA